MKFLTKNVLLIIAGVFLFTMNVLAYSAPTKNAHFLGDADGNLVVTPSDITQHWNYINGKYYTYDTLQPSTVQDRWNTCDINHDRTCSSADISQLVNYITGNVVSLGEDDPWGILTTLAPLQEPLHLITFQAGLFATPPWGQTGVPGVSIEVKIDNVNSTTSGYLTGRSCEGGEGDVPASAGDQCAIGVTITQWDSDPTVGWTELSPLPLGIYADGNGIIELDFEVAEKAALDLPAVTFSQQITFLMEPAMISAGGGHTCELTHSGGVKCWGYNVYGQVGDGWDIDRTTPVYVLGLYSGMTAVSAGGGHTCALSEEGGVKCWGLNMYGELGDGTWDDSFVPVDVVGLSSGVVAISATAGHTCAITQEGGVKCWGYNEYGQLGDGSYDNSSVPVDVMGLSSGVVAISAGWGHTCALTEEGGVKCWGLNIYGQLGDGTLEDSAVPVDVEGLSSGVIAISAGGGHTCALTQGGEVKCWGLNFYGQLGDSTWTDSPVPVDVVGLSSDITAISVGGGHSCALTQSGDVRCWGDNEYGQLGNGTRDNSAIPVDVEGLFSNIVAISAGWGHTCAISQTEGAKCWGYNEYGQLGDGNIYDSLIPVGVLDFVLGGVVVSAGGGHTCVIAQSGGVKCWGYNNEGQLGDGSTEDKYKPVDVVGLTSGVTAVAVGEEHSCALTQTGGMKCWGDNWAGELGDGSTDSRSAPVDVNDLTSGVIAIAVGCYHSCAVTQGGGVKCWGYNSDGQLGDGTTATKYTPVDVVGLTSGVIAIAGGCSHTCAVTQTGGVKCWGNNENGQLGDGTTAERHTPVDVLGLVSGVVAITAGDEHTCAVTAMGGVKCWGDNESGQLGDGTTIDQYSPIDVSGLTAGVIEVSAGGFHTCALTQTNTVKCWGSNWCGQLGDGTTMDQSLPVDVVRLSSPVNAISAGAWYTCAITQADGVICWGY